MLESRQVLAGLIIHPTFDSSIAEDLQAATIEATSNTTPSTTNNTTLNTTLVPYDARFSDWITVNIGFKETASGFSKANTSIFAVPYSTLRSEIVANVTPSNDGTAGDWAVHFAIPVKTLGAPAGATPNLGVGPVNPGITAAWRDVMPFRRSEEDEQRAHEQVTVHGLKKRDRHIFPNSLTRQAFVNCRSSMVPAGKMSQSRAVNGYHEQAFSANAWAKSATTKTGNAMHPKTRKALLKALKKPKSGSHRLAISKALKAAMIRRLMGVAMTRCWVKEQSCHVNRSFSSILRLT